VSCSDSIGLQYKCTRSGVLTSAGFIRGKLLSGSNGKCLLGMRGPETQRNKDAGLASEALAREER
jgi:hypothetical protein